MSRAADPAACRPLAACLACGSRSLEPYLDLGAQPLANSYAADTRALPRFPLGVALCPACFHSQLTHAVDPDLLFRHYLYVSGTTRTLDEYFASLAALLTRRHGHGLHVLDIASNDGSFLAHCLAQGHRVTGVDPAQNLLPLARARGVETRVAYWDRDLARDVEPADVIVAMNVVGHVPDPLAFLSACRAALKPGGTIYLQTSQANIFRNWEFDTVYHEHHSFFTTRSMRALAARAGLALVAVEIVPVHGGSYRWELRDADAAAGLPAEDEERRNGFYDPATYRRFQAQADRIAAAAVDAAAALRLRGFAVGAYGAAAKGNTFVNFARLALDFMVDDNPLKCGLRSPGMDTPIVPASTLARHDGPLALLVLAWNFFDEIAGRVAKARPGRETLLLRAFPSWEERRVGGEG